VFLAQPPPVEGRAQLDPSFRFGRPAALAGRRQTVLPIVGASVEFA